MKNARVIALLVLIVAGVFVIWGGYEYVNTLRNESIGWETKLSAQYLSNQNYLSAYISGFYEQLGVANLKSEKMDEILIDAVKGRYDDEGFSSKGAFFSVIVEAYPNIAGLNIYDKIADYVAGGREGYRGIQDKLMDMLRAYDKWRQEGYIRGWIISTIIGVPTERLVAKIGDTTMTSSDARNKMYQIVLTPKAVEVYKNGRMEPLSVK